MTPREIFILKIHSVPIGYGFYLKHFDVSSNRFGRRFVLWPRVFAGGVVVFAVMFGIFGY